MVGVVRRFETTMSLMDGVDCIEVELLLSDVGKHEYWLSVASSMLS